MDNSADNVANEKNSNFDDIFNLNSFIKEEYLLRNSKSNKRHRKSRDSHKSSSSSKSSQNSTKSIISSSSNSSRSRSTSWSSSRSSNSSRSRSSSRNSSSSSRSRRRSSSSSSTSSSSSSDYRPTRLKSVVILVKKSPLKRFNEDNSTKYDEENERNRKYTRNNNHFEYVNPKARMICTPPLPSLEYNYHLPNASNYNYNNINSYYHSYSGPPPVPAPIPPPVAAMSTYSYLAPSRNQFRPISPPVKENLINQQQNSPLNQYQEVSSTINQNDACCSNQISGLTTKPLVENNMSETDDLFSFKSKLQEQLKLKLFDSNTKFPSLDDIKSLNNSSFSSSTNLNESSSRPTKKRKKYKKEHKNRDKKRHRHKSTKPSKEDNNSNNSDNDDTNLRRSSRIKTIETIKQHHKVMKIAEIVKNHNNNNQSAGVDVVVSIDQNETTTIKQDESVIANPIKVKDRWRRYSEKDSYDSMSPQSQTNNNNNNLQSTDSIENNLSLANLMLKPNSMNSPNLTNSPRAYKKILLDKAVNELGILNSPTTNTNTEDDDNNDNEFENNEPEVKHNFELIDENLYLCKRSKLSKLNKDAKRMICDCSTSQQERLLGIAACGDDCLNRLLMIECGNNCNCDEYCTNKNFKNKNNASIVPFKTELKGLGLKSKNELKPNTFLIEYVGEVINVKEFKKRFEKYSDSNIEHFYFMSLQNNLFIDATRKGNISRYFNHSCDPNCETQKWTVNGELRIGFFSRRQISANEELTFDYQFQTVGKKQQKCYCGSEKCRGYLGMSDKQQSNSLNYIWEDDSSSEQEEEESDSDSSVKKSSNNNNKPKDYDLNRQIEGINSLNNKESILKLCQLMFRTENTESRIDILNLLLSTNSELSLRLFMDYHGLKLLSAWMLDIDSLYDTLTQIECKIKIIKVLSSLTIKNRTTVEECKLLSMVKRWSDKTETKITEIDETRNEDESIKQELKVLSDLSKELYDKWSDLQQAFKIPKKQRVEERKEHERELNDSYFNRTSIEHEFINKINNNNRYNTNRPFYKRNNSFNRYNAFSNNNRFNPIPIPNQQLNQSANLAKEQRRQQFEQKVRQEELEAASRAAAEEAALLAAATVPEPTEKPIQELKWIFDQKLNQWIQCYVPVNTLPLALNEYNLMLPPPPPPLPPPPPTPSQHYRFTHFDLNATSIIASKSTTSNNNNTINNHINNINLTESNFQDLEQAVRLFMPFDMMNKQKELAPRTITPLSPSIDDQSMAKLNKTAKLPPSWKCKKNKRGKIYYLNVKTKKSQWHFPRIKPTAATAIKITNAQQASTIERKTDESLLITSTTNETLPITSNELSKEKTDDNDLSSSSMTTSVINTNESLSNTFKLYKDQFRDKLSKLIIKILEQYLKKDCIKSTDDFKHLARKFTHTIMEIEVSSTTKIEELDLNKRVKIKTEEYINQYMKKFKNGYSRKNDLA